MSPILPPKKDVALALLEKASVFVHLDPRPDDVMVPAWLKSQAQLVLQLGLNMAVKIPDLEVGEDSVSCTLSFSRRPCYCQVPWHAVYALVGEDGRGMVWPEDIPPEVASQSQAPPAPRRNTLRAVASLPDERTEDTQGAEEHRAGSSDRPPLPYSEPPSLVSSATTSEPPAVPAIAGASAEASGDSRRSPSERPYLRLIK